MLQVTSSPLPEPFENGFLFNTSSYLKTKFYKTKSFQLKNNSSNLLAQLSFSIIDGVAISLHQSTFGSIEYLDNVSLTDLRFFLEKVITTLRSENISKMIIRHYPTCYLGDKADIAHQLLKPISNHILEDVNQHIIVDEDFETKLFRNEKKKLRKCNKEGFKISLGDLNDLPEFYAIYNNSRIAKGYPVTMTLELMRSSMMLLPNNYYLFLVKDGDKVIAGSYSVRLSDTCMYNLYHADDIAYRKYSPTVMAVQGAYNHCLQNGIHLLDIGISSDNGVLNEGLYKFKKKIGCMDSVKRVYTIPLLRIC